MNQVCFLGRMVRDPELRITKGDKSVVKFSIAVTRQFPKPDGTREADFFDCIAWGKQAEVIADHFNKGERISVTGRMQNNNYKAKDGRFIKSNEVWVESFDFIEKLSDKKNSEDDGNTGMESFGSNVPADEDIPF